MKFSLKTLAAAVVMAAAASSSFAAIDNGAGGNGELFLNVWDANGSYSRDLNMTIDAFQSALAAPTALNLLWAADANMDSFLNGATGVKWNIMATDTAGARRVLVTYTAPAPVTGTQNGTIRTIAGNISGQVGFVNTALNGADSVIVDKANAAWAGKAAMGEKFNNLLNFSTAGTLDNMSFASGLGFMRIDALASGTAPSVYNGYLDITGSTSTVNVYLDANRTLHIQALPVPEPESYAMLLAGLGMIGFMARRNKRA